MVLLLPYGWNCWKWDMKMVSEELNCSNMKNFLYSDIVGGCKGMWKEHSKSCKTGNEFADCDVGPIRACPAVRSRMTLQKKSHIRD
jgi:hypothetical protein